MSWITGYKIPFFKKPVQKYVPNNRFNKAEISNLKETIGKLLQIKAVSQCKKSKYDFYSSYFLTSKKDGSYRFILNLKNLNRFLSPLHFKLEDYRTLLKLIYQNCFFTTIDLKDAYYLIPIHVRYRSYLRFIFNRSIYQFNCLPFGLSTAPFVFTKLLKPVMQALREQGISLLIFLDDIIVIGQSYEECLTFTKSVSDLLIKLGFIINNEKSSLIPSKFCTYLGFTFDSVKMTMSLPAEKKLAIWKDSIKMYNTCSCKIRTFAAYIGKLIATCPATNYGWLYTKSFESVKYRELKFNNGNFDAIMKLPKSLGKDFQWWIKNIYTVTRNINKGNFKLIIASDASLTGWGGFCNGEKIHGFWDKTLKEENIHYLELLAAFNATKSFCKNISNCHILLRIDNTTAISYINKMGGTKFKKLNSITKKIWKWCEAKNNFIFASYINTKHNVEADAESRSLSIETEYELSNIYFKLICCKFGKPSIDLFATQLNTKCHRYISWHKDPDSLEADAFTVNWEEEFFYAFPPFAIITKVLYKIIQDRAEGILVVPRWTSQPWYPMFRKLLKKDPIIFDPDPQLIISPFRDPHPLWRQLFLVAGNVSGRRFYQGASQ